MRYDPTRQLLTRCLERVTSDDAGYFIDNPAIPFTNDVKAGKYDHLSDDEYEALLHRIERLSGHWNKQPRRTAGDILLAVLERITIPPDRLESIAKSLMEWYAWEESERDEAGRGGIIAGEKAGDVLTSAFAPRTPAMIRDAIAGSVIGQPEAVKAAAMITYHHLAGRRTNAVFCGPSGCGKSETWRCLSKEYPGLIRIVDFSRMSADGWKGSLHLRDIFTGVDPDDLRRRGLIVVLDEADKILCEHALGAGGTDYNAIVQNSLLKMLDGDVIEFGSENGQPALSVDCSTVTVVMLGAFERLLEGKASGAKRVGFGAAPKDGPGSHKDISYDDLIRAGMRREVAGRVNKIVALRPISADGCKAILRGPVLSGLQESIGCRISIDDAAADALAEQTVRSQLGVRWMRSALQNAIDDAMFDTSGTKDYRITMRDGTLCCQALSPHEDAPARPHTGPDGDLDPDDELPF